jgi:hypothetical protein
VKPEPPFSLPSEISPEDTLYIADRDLKIVYTNDGWQQFAQENRGERLLGEGWKPGVLDNMSGNEKVRWGSIYKMLLDGRLPYHEEDFICPSPVERRLYKMRITPEKDEKGEIAWLVHHTVRVDQQEKPGTVLSRCLRRLDEDPAYAVEEYRRRVIGRNLRVEGFRTARHFKPLGVIGGDLLWDRQHDDRITDLVIADVVGHGEEAGRFATKIVFMLDDIVSRNVAVPPTLARLNQAILDATPGDGVVFATGLFLRLDTERRRITACSFGHEPPIFSRTGPIQLDTGPPVGMIEEPDPWPENYLELDDHGQRFLIFSDGITEQFNIDGEMFGIDGLLREFLKGLNKPLDRMLQGVVRYLESFRGEALTKDDQTLLGLECASD